MKRALLYIGVICLWSSMTFALNTDPVKGIYLFFNIPRADDPLVPDLPFVQGISIRIPWAKIEPKQGYYDFSQIDEAMKKAKALGKKVMLRVVPGYYSPEWLVSKGVKGVYLKNSLTLVTRYNRRGFYPLPWDDKYLDFWTHTVEELGKRYGNDDALVMVHLAGPTYRTTATSLPRDGIKARQMVQAGYSPEKIIDAWKKVFIAYNQAFKKNALSLNIDNPITADGTLEKIVALAEKTIGKRLYFQSNSLKEKMNLNSNIMVLLKKLSKKHPKRLGFRFISPALKRAPLGDLKKTLNLGVSLGASFIEIFRPEALDKKNQEVLNTISQRLRGIKATKEKNGEKKDKENSAKTSPTAK